MLLRRGEKSSIVDDNVFFLVVCCVLAAAVPTVDDLLSLLLNVYFSEAVVYEDMRRSFDFLVYFLPRTAVRKCSSYVSADGGVLISLWALAPSVEAVSRVRRFDIILLL